VAQRMNRRLFNVWQRLTLRLLRFAYTRTRNLAAWLSGQYNGLLRKWTGRRA